LFYKIKTLAGNVLPKTKDVNMAKKGILWVIGNLALVLLIVACSTTVAFRVMDMDTGEDISDYTITVDAKTLHPGDTISLSTADWEDFSARVQANGYRVETRFLDKKLYAGRLAVGILLFWPELGWCYGPKKAQVFYLIKNKE
jgi:hypothetical protein